VVRLANGESLQALVQNQGQPLTWQQGTATAVHLPADALRVLSDPSAQQKPQRRRAWVKGDL
jgi:hypothetical protein